MSNFKDIKKNLGKSNLFSAKKNTKKVQNYYPKEKSNLSSSYKVNGSKIVHDSLKEYSLEPYKNNRKSINNRPLSCDKSLGKNKKVNNKCSLYGLTKELNLLKNNDSNNNNNITRLLFKVKRSDYNHNFNKIFKKINV